MEAWVEARSIKNYKFLHLGQTFLQFPQDHCQTVCLAILL